jgi:hypothetical protein
MIKRLEEAEASCQKEALLHHRVWQVVMCVSVTTGFGGAAILAFAFAKEIVALGSGGG